MKYIRKDNHLINLEKCYDIKISDFQSGMGPIWYKLVFQKENGDVCFVYETKEEVRRDMMKIEEFTTNVKGLLKL